MTLAAATPSGPGRGPGGPPTAHGSRMSVSQSPTVVRRSGSTGLVISLLFTEAFGLSAGGMIVPGYFALSLNQPWAVVLTILAAGINFGLVRLVSKWATVYGRRKIVITVIIGFTIGVLIRDAGMMLHGTDADAAAPLAVIGFIIPGLIALWFDRQGVVETVSTLMTSSVVVRLVLILLGTEMLV